MGSETLTTTLGGDLTLLGPFDKLAAPCCARASEASRKTLEPLKDMLPARGYWDSTSTIAITTDRTSKR